MAVLAYWKPLRVYQTCKSNILVSEVRWSPHNSCRSWLYNMCMGISSWVYHFHYRQKTKSKQNTTYLKMDICISWQL